jgi:hypothetical protein
MPSLAKCLAVPECVAVVASDIEVKRIVCEGFEQVFLHVDVQVVEWYASRCLSQSGLPQSAKV